MQWIAIRISPATYENGQKRNHSREGKTLVGGHNNFRFSFFNLELHFPLKDTLRGQGEEGEIEFTHTYQPVESIYELPPPQDCRAAKGFRHTRGQSMKNDLRFLSR